MAFVRAGTFVTAAWVGLIAGVAFSGCASEESPVPSPHMPQVISPPRPEPRPDVSAHEVLARAVEQVEWDDFSGAIHALETLPVAERVPAVRELVRSIAARDPGQAGSVALAMPAGEMQDAALDIAGRAMLDRDRDTALPWALARPEPAVRFTLLRAMADHLVVRDARGALEWLLALPDSPHRAEILTLAAARCARDDAVAALTWARSLPAVELRDRLTTSIGFELAQTTPERAVAVPELLPAGRDRWLLVGAIGRTWVARDPKAALAWAHALPAGAPREAALAGIDAGLGIASFRSRAVGEVGTAGHPGDAVAQASGMPLARPVEAALLPLGPERDRALWRQFEERLLASPVRAADWLSSLPAPDRSDEMVDRLAREWFAINPAAAETWLDQNILSSVRREQLRRDARR